jgi:peptide/nickel transport system substrate-binding protein
VNRFHILLAAVSLWIVACSHAGSRHIGGSQLVFTGLAGEPDSLNPMLSNEADELNFSHLYMSYLIENDDRGNAIPEIALEVPSLANGGISSDQRTVTYKIRRNVRWQDGLPLTARDVVFSYGAIVDPRNNVPTRVGYAEVQSIRATDAHTVVVHLRRRFSPFVQYFFGPQGVGAIMPAHLLAGRRDLNHAAFNEHPVGSGPYRILQWRRGDSITLAANPFYWRGKPRIARLVYRIVPDPNTRLEALQTGEADAYFDVDPQLLPQLRMFAGVKISLTPIADFHVLRFNLRDPALRDVRVRRAIAMAIDRTSLVAAATHGSGLIVDADQPSNGWAYDAATPAIRYNPVGARRLLNGRSLDVTLAIAPQIINGSQLVATVLQEDLRRIGIGAVIKQYPSAMYYGSAASGGILAGGRYELAYDAWWVLGNDPDDSWNVGCDQIPPAGLNYSFWCAARKDEASRDALAYVNRARRKSDYRVVQRAIAQDLPFFTLWQVRIPDAYRTYVHGIAPSPAGSTFWNAWDWSVSS